MQLLNHLKKRRANGRERHVVFSGNRWKQSGRDFLALLMLGSVLSLGACGGADGGSNSASTAPISTATIIGSAGDGPITGGVVSVADANGATVITVPANPVTNAQAKFNFTVPTSTALPITITVTGGTDIVTGISQDFPLTTAVTTLPAAGTVTGNANPLSTLTVASALAQGGGSLTAANLTAAGNNLLGAMGFGLVAGVDPITTPVNNANIASVVRANEAAAELIRRASVSTGLGIANTITSIAQDLTDGVVDGNAAAGAMATQVSAINAAHIVNQQAQVSAETLANNLNLSTPAGAPLAAVSGANFTTTLNNAITTIGNTGDVAAEAPSQAFLDQTRRAISVANILSGGGNAALQSMNANLNALSATITTTTAQHSTLSAAITAGVTAFTTATTAANNPTTAAASLAIQTDRIAPVAPVITTPVAGSNTTNNMLTVSGSAEAGGLISLMDGAAYIASATADAAGAWSLNTPLTVGVHTLKAVANDIAGNTSPVSTAISVTIVANSAPTASAVSITGTATVGSTLTGAYTYNDANGDVQGVSTFRWLRNSTAIIGATANAYTIVAADSGQSISFEVTPVAATGVALGAAIASTAVTVVNTAPTVTAVSINVNGVASIGNTLNSSYTYNDVDGDVEGASTYRWLRGGVAIAGATATSYILIAADSGQSISFEVTPVAATGILTGTAVVSSAVTAITPNIAPAATSNLPSSGGVTNVGSVVAPAGSGTAQLGYISGGSVKLFDLSNLNKPIATTTSTTSINPTKAGSFSFSGVTLSANKYYLIEISGGFDIDVNDDGIIDTTTQAALKGKVYSLAKGSALTSGNVRINALSDMAYQRIKGSLSTLTVAQIDAALTKSAKAYLYDVNGDGKVDQTDILAFDPVKDRLKTIRPYKDILDIYVPKLHRGDTDAVKLSSLMYLNAPKIVIANGNLQTVPFTLKASITNIPGNTTTKWFFNGIAKPAINEAITVDGIYAVTAKIYQGLSLLKTVQAQVIGSTNIAVATVNVDITKDNTVFVTDASKSSLAGTQVIIPKGALAKNTIITIKKASINQIPNTGGAGVSDVIVMEPSGLTFSKPVQIRLPYNPNVNLTGKAVRIARYSANGVVDYISPLFVDQYTHEVVFETDHFTQFKAETNWLTFGGLKSKSNQPTIKEIEKYTGITTYTTQQWIDILNSTIYKNFTVYDYVMSALKNNKIVNIIDKPGGSTAKYAVAYNELYSKDTLARSSWKSAKTAFEFIAAAEGGAQALVSGIVEGKLLKATIEGYGVVMGQDIPTELSNIKIYDPLTLADSLFKIGVNITEGTLIDKYIALCSTKSNRKTNTFVCNSNDDALKRNQMFAGTKLLANRYNTRIKLIAQLKAHPKMITPKTKVINLINTTMQKINNPPPVSTVGVGTPLWLIPTPEFTGFNSAGTKLFSGIINTKVSINVEIKVLNNNGFSPKFNLYNNGIGKLIQTLTPIKPATAKGRYTTTLDVPVPPVKGVYSYYIADGTGSVSGRIRFNVNAKVAKKQATTTSITKSVYLDANGNYLGHFWMNFKTTGSMNPAVLTSFKFNGITYNGDTFTIPKADWNNPALATALANISVTIKPATTSVASAYNITPLTFSVDLKAAYAAPVANAIPQLKIIAINGTPRLANQQNSPVTINAGDNVTFAIDQRNIKSIISSRFGGSSTTYNLSQTYTVGYNSSGTYTPSIKIQLNTGATPTIPGPTVTVRPAPVVTLPSISISGRSQKEGNTVSFKMPFKVMLSSKSTSPVTVAYKTTNGTALASSDYTATTGTLTIPAGKTIGGVLVNISADTLVENDETFTVTLSSPTNAQLGTSVGTGTIVNDDFAAILPNVTKLSPSTAQAGKLTTFTVTGTNLPKTIWMQLSGAACMAVYQSTATSAKVDCMPSGSGNTSFFIRDKKGGTILKGPSGRFVLVSAVPTVALPTVSISNVSKLEGNTKNSLLFFKIKLSAASTSAVTVQYSTTDGTATSAGIASDYIAKSGTLTISPGKTVGTIFIVIKGDTLVEPDQRFTVTLSAPTGAALASSSVAEGTIVNDDFRVIKLNDTGITKWGDATLNNLTTKQASFLGQDADLGRDARVAAGTLVKKGGGKAGFDFTKLDAVGQPLANQAAAYATTPWTCVQDNVTGLMWEVKTTPSLGGLRDAASSYSWYNSTGVNDGGNAGTANGGFCEGGVNCDTEKYVAAVNAVGMCGFKDWRLPSVEALRSLVDLSVIPFGRMTGIDVNYFPNTQASVYWAVSPDAILSTTNAWGVSFDGGNAFSAPKSNTMTVRLVRGTW